MFSAPAPGFSWSANDVKERRRHACNSRFPTLLQKNEARHYCRSSPCFGVRSERPRHDPVTAYRGGPVERTARLFFSHTLTAIDLNCVIARVPFARRRGDARPATRVITNAVGLRHISRAWRVSRSSSTSTTSSKSAPHLMAGHMPRYRSFRSTARPLIWILLAVVGSIASYQAVRASQRVRPNLSAASNSATSPVTPSGFPVA